MIIIRHPPPVNRINPLAFSLQSGGAANEGMQETKSHLPLNRSAVNMPDVQFRSPSRPPVSNVFLPDDGGSNMYIIESDFVTLKASFFPIFLFPHA